MSDREKKEEQGTRSSLTHLDERGEARMVDVGAKAATRRRAVARARLFMREETRSMIVEGRAAKGDVFATARIAGIMAAKRTGELIPMCHPISLTHVSIDIDAGRGEEPGDERRGVSGGEHGRAEVVIRAVCETTGRTGVEMEALTAASVAALTLYDMCKAVDRGMIVGEVMLLEKEGGASGSWSRESDDVEPPEPSPGE